MKEKLKKDYKPSPFGPIPIDWSFVALSNVSTIGTGSTPSTEISKYWANGTIPWLPTGKVNDRIIVRSERLLPKKQ